MTEIYFLIVVSAQAVSTQAVSQTEGNVSIDKARESDVDFVSSLAEGVQE